MTETKHTAVFRAEGSDIRLMDHTLTILSLEPMKEVTKLHRRSLRAPGKSEHHDVPGKKKRSLTSRPQVPVSTQTSKDRTREKARDSRRVRHQLRAATVCGEDEASAAVR